MGRWAKDAKEFATNINFDPRRGNQVTIPRPIMERLGDPKAITWVARGSTVRVIAGRKESTKNQQTIKPKLSTNP